MSETIANLVSGESNYVSTSDEGSKADWAKKVDVAKESFKEVLASDEHEDGKAQRILTAMAFLTAAAGLIFAELSRARIAPSLEFPIFAGYAYMPVCFFIFVAAMLIGTLFFLAALGPAFNIPRPWHTKDTERYPQSLLFSQLILQGTRDQWTKYWEESNHKNLQVELVKNYVNEAYLLAEKVKFKVSSMRIGKVFYKLSLGFLGMLVIPIFTTDVNQVYSWAAWVFAIILFQDLLERATSPPRWKWSKEMFKWRSLLSINLLLTLVELGGGVFLVTIGIAIWFG